MSRLWLKEAAELSSRVDATSKALEKAAKLPFFGSPSDEATAAFKDLFEEVDMADVFESLKDPTTVVVLSKLGAIHESAKKDLETRTKRLTNNQLRFQGLQKTVTKRKDNAKKTALLKLDEEDQLEVQKKKNRRRRMLWNVMMEKKGKQPKKRIQESFEGMEPKKLHRPKLTIQERLEVVQFLEKKKQEMKAQNQRDDELNEEDESEAARTLA